MCVVLHFDLVVHRLPVRDSQLILPQVISMTWFEDLSIFTYSSPGESNVLYAVGWLDSSHPFCRGRVELIVFERLTELLQDPWQPVVALGSHSCELCQFVPEAHGRRNLLVPGAGRIFVCPDLILHYINAHQYRPPEEFCTEVMNCPNTRTMEYKRRLLAEGWRQVPRDGIEM